MGEEKEEEVVVVVLVLELVLVVVLVVVPVQDHNWVVDAGVVVGVGVGKQVHREAYTFFRGLIWVS